MKLYYDTLLMKRFSNDKCSNVKGKVEFIVKNNTGMCQKNKINLNKSF